MVKKVALALSGGVDSAVAAFLLLKKGYKIEAFTLWLCGSGGEAGAAAEKLCLKLNIPHHILDVREVFKKQIQDYFIASYLAGLTPNPCVFCNALIKFGWLFEYVSSCNFEYLATGHYACIEKQGDNFCFRQAKDIKKSQEYFLSLVPPAVLKHLIFPLGNYTKAEVKKIASEHKMIFEPRPESQDICFIDGRDYGRFIKENISTLDKYKGEIQHISGKVFGRHNGFYNFTYGQRSGLGIAWKEPLYVVGIDSKKAVVLVGEKKYLYKNEFEVSALNWFLPVKKYEKDLKVRIRYNSPLYDCRIEIREDSVKVFLEDKIDAVTPGQIAAFYSSGIVIGAGVINSMSTS